MLEAKVIMQFSLQQFSGRYFSLSYEQMCSGWKFTGRRAHICLTRQGMPFPLHLVSVHHTSQSTMRLLPQAQQPVFFCILGFFCHPWETAWWSGIMGICFPKSWFPTLSSSRSSGWVTRALDLGLKYISAINSHVTLEKLLIFFSWVLSFANTSLIMLIF